MRRRLSLVLVAAAAAAALPAQTYEVIHDFGATPADPSAPLGRLLLGPDANFYGVTTYGGNPNCPQGCGTIYRLDANGTVTTVHAFDGAGDGENPAGDLLLASDGNFYGVTPGDGALEETCLVHCGTVFRFDTNGNFVTLHTFGTLDGFGVNPQLAEPLTGELWGTTIAGGGGDCEDDTCGAVFRLRFDGSYQVMHAFSRAEANWPVGGLVFANDGNLYGATLRGDETDGLRTVIQVALNGHVSKIYDFESDCSSPTEGFIQVVSGELVGTCANGSRVFRLTLGGNFQEIHAFTDPVADGFAPSRPMQAGDALLYGVTSAGGTHDAGTIHQLGLTGAFTKLYDFEEPTGSLPFAGLTQSPDGRFYGATFSGGAHLHGTIFRLTMPGLTRYYCPNNFVRRDQMAVFLLKTAHGSGFVPAACSGDFADVACPSLFADWIEQLAAEGITAGCAGGNYCPLSPVTRGQMAVFLLKTEHGPAYTPPSCTGVFDDVPCSHQFAAWIEQLFAEGITGGCGGDDFCPDLPVTRAQMAVFLLKIEHGGTYVPPTCQPTFADVICPSLFAPWIEQLYEEHITAGCAGPP